MSGISVNVFSASVLFPAQSADRLSLKSYWTKLLEAKPVSRPHIQALVNINLSINSGERLGIIGSNGAGKTTLLRLLSGIYTPNSGKVVIEGRVSPLLDLGVGFDFDLTGRDNIKLRMLFLGLSPTQIEPLAPEIIEFARLGQFIDQPLKSYSSGMFLRLAFAIATCVEPEILILDEFLSAGDRSFQRLAEARMDRVLEMGKIVIVASHAIEVVRDRCTRVLWLNNGRIEADGAPEDVVTDYLRYAQA